MKKQMIRWWDWPAIFFLSGALFTVSTRLLDSGWTEVLAPVEFVVVYAIVLGVLLGKSMFHWRIVLWMSILFTIFFVPWQLGTLYERFIWENRLPFMVEKFITSIYMVSQNQPVRDPFLFVSVMSLLFWTFSLMGAYQLVRNNRPWLPILVAALTFVLIDYYNPRVENRLLYGAFFVLFVLLLAGRLYFLRRRREWEKEEIEYDLEASFDQGRLLIVAGALLVLVSWNIPSFIDLLNPATKTGSDFERTLDDLRNRLGNAMAGLETAVVSSSDVYGSSFSLGTGAPLGEDLVFVAQLTEPKPQGTRLYWIGRTYEVYDGVKWTSRVNERYLGVPGRWPFARPLYESRKIVNMNVIPYVDLMSAVYYPSLPIYTSNPVRVMARTVSEDGSQADITGLAAEPPLRSGQNFRLQALISTVSIEELQAAGTEYPDWILDSYLQLPEEIPTRVVELAHSITEGAETPYEKAEAVTEYLRRNITYVKSVPRLPDYRDLVDWFLFDQRAGFCNYYASSEVVLLRAVGVPARMVVGFAEGESEIAGDEFTVLRKHAHAWPEVFFPGYGWLEFEPTVIYPEIDRPESKSRDRPPDEEIGPEEEMEQPEQEPSRGRSFATPFREGTPLIAVWAVFLLIISGTSTGLWLWTRRKYPDLAAPLPPVFERIFSRVGWVVPEWMRSRKLAEIDLLPVERLFAQVGRMLRMLGKPVQVAQTPSEQVSMLITTLPETEMPALDLLNEFHRSIYGPYPVDMERARKANRALWRVILPTWVRRKLHLSSSRGKI